MNKLSFEDLKIGDVFISSFCNIKCIGLKIEDMKYIDIYNINKKKLIDYSPSLSYEYWTDSAKFYEQLFHIQNFEYTKKCFKDVQNIFIKNYLEYLI